jgi:hypothetical protein
MLLVFFAGSGRPPSVRDFPLFFFDFGGDFVVTDRSLPSTRLSFFTALPAG